MSDHIIKAIAAALAGAAISWVASALTLTGRVEAIEKSLARIEARMEIQAQAAAKAKP